MGEMSEAVRAALEQADAYDSLDARQGDVPGYEYAVERALEALAAEVRRLHRQTCATCKQELRGECRLTLTDDVDEHGDLVGAKMMPCSMFGNGCRAHEPKAGA